jgi:hypothetical protein
VSVSTAVRQTAPPAVSHHDWRPEEVGR